jgi:hypothetical protein
MFKDKPAEPAEGTPEHFKKIEDEMEQWEMEKHNVRRRKEWWR